MNDYNTHQEFGSGDRIVIMVLMICLEILNMLSILMLQSDHKVVLQPLTTHNGDYDASFSKGHIY